MPRCGIVGPYSRSILNFFRNLLFVLHSGCINLFVFFFFKDHVFFYVAVLGLSCDTWNL